MISCTLASPLVRERIPGCRVPPLSQQLNATPAAAVRAAAVYLSLSLSPCPCPCPASSSTRRIPHSARLRQAREHGERDQPRDARLVAVVGTRQDACDSGIDDDSSPEENLHAQHV